MNKHIGSTLDSLLDELGEKEEIELLAQKKRIASRLLECMEALRITKAKLARLMRTSRTEVYNLLDPNDTGVTLATMSKASRALGMNMDVVMTLPARKKTQRAHAR